MYIPKPLCHGCGAPTAAPIWRVDEHEYTALCSKCATRLHAMFTPAAAIAEAQARIRATLRYLNNLALAEMRGQS